MTGIDRNAGIAKGMAPGSAVAVGVLREAEIWTSAQCELLSGMGARWADWMTRQCEAIDASSRALLQMYECRTLADLAELQRRWFADAARRGASDFGAWASDAVAVTRRTADEDPAASVLSVSGRPRAAAKLGEETSAPRAAAE